MSPSGMNEFPVPEIESLRNNQAVYDSILRSSTSRWLRDCLCITLRGNYVYGVT